MGWNTIEPYIPATKTDVRVAIIKIGKGNAVPAITLNRHILRKLGSPDSCNVFIGDGEEKGQILLQFDDDGACELPKRKMGGTYLKLNPLRDMPQEKMRRTGVRYEERETDDGVKQLAIWLPWN